MIELRDVRKSYKIGPVTTHVLNGIHLKLEKGDLISIMGPSGSGKSTLMNIMGLMDTSYSGSYRIEGHDTGTMGDRRLSRLRNRHIGFVFQAFNLIGHLSALENVALPLLYRRVRKSKARNEAHDVLTKVGMADKFSHRPEQLSGGQRQRVAIARALVANPSFILADEPTGALDSDNADGVMELLFQLNQEDGMAVVIITHNPLIHRLIPRKAIIQDGILLEARSTGP